MKSSPLAALSLTVCLTAGLSGPGFAQDIANGEKQFRSCKACHAITALDGTPVVKGGKVGPNLYGVIGRKVGSLDGFRYKDPLKSLGAEGMVWTESELAAYITDPTGWLREKTGDPSARSGMTFKARNDQADIAAYLKSVSQ